MPRAAVIEDCVATPAHRQELRAACKHWFYDEGGAACGTTWLDGPDGTSTGQRLFVVLPRACNKHAYRQKYGEEVASGIVVDGRQVAEEWRQALLEVGQNVLEAVRKLPGCSGAVHHEVVVMLTPPGAVPQRKHRDGDFNWMNVVVSLSASTQPTHGTCVASDYAPPPPGRDNWEQDLEAFAYERLRVPAGGGCAFHGCLPHYGLRLAALRLAA